MKLKKSGFYLVKNEFFENMQDPFLPLQKAGRPIYYCIPDKINKEILWAIPMTTRLDKVNKIIEKAGGEDKCKTYVINTVENNSAFNIRDIFPITENYIEREYLKRGKHYVLKNKALIKKIEIKADNMITFKMIKIRENDIDVRKIYKLLEQELKREKIETIKKIISSNSKDQYNCLTGTQIQIPEREDGENRWISFSFIEKEAIQLKEGKKPTEGLLCGRDGDGSLKLKIGKYYNVSDVIMTKELEQKLVPMKEIIQEKEMKKEREQEIERDL